IYLAQTFNLVHLSTGDLLRQEIAAKTDLGRLADELISKGELVPDSIVISMIEQKLKKPKTTVGFIFDGFPRTVPQAKALDELLRKHHSKVSVMLCLEVEKNELIDRLLKRGLTSGRCDDAEASTIENRINIYNEITAPIIQYYESQGKYHPIQGVGEIREIAARLKETVEKL
ncbi:MAG TPA: adenylate kinase, partial [Prolixibacteraceae bacterium]|nr:adenylate kinase [Prolixibacteraceae bacterium]